MSLKQTPIYKNQKLTIIGGGLTGLTLAYLLGRDGVESTVLEASSRLGGRIQTVVGELGAHLELGATWFSDHHANLLALLDELNLSKHIQYSEGVSFIQQGFSNPIQTVRFPKSPDHSYRIIGGTQILIKKLSENIDSSRLHLSSIVTKISEVKNGVLIKTSEGREYHSERVIICLPPQLISAQQLFDTDQLPSEVSQLLPQVQTWMAGSIKFVLEYEEGFWRKEGYSGMVFTQSGIISEMHDHTNDEGNRFGFTGFLNSAAISIPQEKRESMVINLLSQLLGVKALNPSVYRDKVWINNFVFDKDSEQLPAHHNNGHPLLQKTYLNGKLDFACTETSVRFGGYMEGAIRAAITTHRKILESQIA